MNHYARSSVEQPLKYLRAAFSGAILGAGAMMLSLGACGGGGSSTPSSPTGTGTPGSYTLSGSGLNPMPVTAGHSATAAITLMPANGYIGSVTLACGTISGGIQAPACTFNPATVPIGGTTAATSTLTVSTSINTPGGAYGITVNAKDAKGLAPSNGAAALTLTTAAVIQHIVIIFQENRSTDNLFHDPVLMARGADLASSG